MPTDDDAGGPTVNTTEFFDYLSHPATAELGAALSAVLAGRRISAAARTTSTAAAAPQRIPA
jgi:hypothetical protein